MKLSELIEDVKLEAGQKLVDLEELDMATYKRILEDRVRPVITKHIPYTRHVLVDITASPYVYTEDIPEWISEVSPVQILSVASVLSTYGFGRSIAEAINKPTFLWHYEKPKLYVEFTGNHNVLSCHGLTLTAISGEDDYEINFMEDKALPYVISFTAGYAMIGMGRGRRAATLTDLLFQLDGDNLAHEGKALIEDTLKQVSSAAQWWLSV